MNERTIEVGRVAHGMDLVGLHDEAGKVYEYFLKAPGAKSDGDYSDGEGAFEWATSMRHEMGYSHDGTHASTGRLLFAMADRYFLTDDKEWFERNRVRMQAAADWIIRQRNSSMKDVPNRQDLLVAGLMPPCMLGDYAIPSCDWHWYYCDNAFALQGLRRFADALAQLDPEAGRNGDIWVSTPTAPIPTTGYCWSIRSQTLPSLGCLSSIAFPARLHPPNDANAGSPSLLCLVTKSRSWSLTQASHRDLFFG